MFSSFFLAEITISTALAPTSTNIPGAGLMLSAKMAPAKQSSQYPSTKTKALVISSTSTNNHKFLLVPPPKRIKHNKHMEKTITVDQRKMLSKLYEEKVNTKIIQLKNRRMEKKEKLIKEVIKKGASAQLKLAEKYFALKAEMAKIEKQIEDDCRGTNFRFSTYDNEGGIRLADHDDSLEVSTFEEETRNINDQMSEIKNKILTEIWGLSAGYAEICSLIEKEFKAIEV